MPRIPRGSPLEADRWYVSPVAIEPDPRWPDRPPYQARQGDVFSDVASIWLASRPIAIARDYQPEGNRTRFYRYFEDEHPAHPFDWEHGEDFIVRGIRTWAVLMTMDCDLDTIRPFLTFALYRTFDHTHSERTRGLVRRRARYRSWYMPPLDGLQLPEGYVDFARLTTVHPSAVDLATRRASMTDEVRDTLRIDFMDFLNLEREEHHEGGGDI